jgi:RNA polymerase sigma factor (sigma-70 family)
MAKIPDFNEKILEALEKGDYEKVISLSDTIIYYHMHTHGLWNLFPADRDDFLQEGRIAILRCIKTYNRKEKFATYAHTAVRNALFTYAKRMKLYDIRNYTEINDTYHGEDDEVVKSFSMTGYYIEKYAKPKHVDILNRHFINGETQVSIAKSSGFRQQRVAGIVSRFKKKVKSKHGNK